MPKFFILSSFFSYTNIFIVVAFHLLLLFASKGVIVEPNIAAMSNSGWNNEACLAAAKELRQSFQKSGGKNAMRNTGRDRGNRSSSSSIPMKRQGKHTAVFSRALSSI
jgi:hypothetical protein